MHTIGVGELKAHFSDVLNGIRRGEEFVITFGRRKSRLAALIPFRRYRSSKKKRTLGVLADRGPVRFSKDFKMTDEDFLRS